MKEILYEKSFASHPKSKYWSNKNDLKPNQVSKSSNKKYQFYCKICRHEFSITLGHITNGNRWCPYCANQKLCENNDCKDCFDKSFASHPKSKFWSKENKMIPRQVFKSSNTKYLYHCEVCNHDFEKKPNKITNSNRWCPFCVNQKLCENEDCKICFDKSFASHPKSKFWSKENKMIPRQIFKSSGIKYLYDCDICNHQFKSILSNITNLNSWCPYCTNQKLCENEDCKYCFKNSFASHPKSKFWNKKNTVTPRQVFKSANSKYWYDCDKCNNEFESILNSVTSGCTWCPYCKNKTELKLFEWLKEIYPNVKTQVKFNWSQNKRYDFYLEELKLIIELDGAQHFEQVSNWQSPKNTQINDILKNNLALENNYRMIRICQRIVWNDIEDWEIQLKNIIARHEDINNSNNNLVKIGSIYN